MAWVVLVGGFVGGVSQTLAEVVWVAWVQKLLVRVKKMAGVETLVWGKHDFMNFCYDSIKFYCFKL